MKKERTKQLEARAECTKFCLPVHWETDCPGKPDESGKMVPEAKMLPYFLGLFCVWQILLKHALNQIMQNYLHMSLFKSLKPTSCLHMCLKYIPYQFSAYEISAHVKSYHEPSVQASDL